MRPLEGYPGVWVCAKHELYATVVPEDVVESLERGDPFTMHDDTEGVASRTGDDRPGGVVLYYRPKISA
ncbi:MAG: hypothetical protein AB7G88_04480 [Thermomicrobiales bacterium]